jgi:assimilatory nitrate reductase catalytic subunit
MHWNDVFASNAAVDALVNPVTDPISGQPESKHTPAHVRPYAAAWYGFLLSRRNLNVGAGLVPARGATTTVTPTEQNGDMLSFWSRAKGAGFYRYELAGEVVPEDWAAWARQLLCHSDGKAEWIELFDKKAGRYRAARIVDGRLESCLFVARDPALPARSWLAQLFEQVTLDAAARNSLLSGKPAPGQVDQGEIVCACFGVGANAIKSAIAGGCTSVEQIGARLKAGTNCGSCIPELKRLLGGS